MSRPLPASLPPLPVRPVSADALLEWAERVPGLRIEYTPMPGEGARYSRGFGPVGGGVVRIDRRLQGPALTCALAEEIGHHLTFHDLPMPCGARGARNEHLALRWAADLLLPPQWLDAAVSAGDATRRWWVTEEFVARAARLFPGGNGTRTTVRSRRRAGAHPGRTPSGRLTTGRSASSDHLPGTSPPSGG